MTIASVPVLVGGRVRLRPYRPDDRDALFGLYGDPEVVRYWSFPAWTDRAQADSYLATVVPKGEGPPTVYPWAVAALDDDLLIGTATFFSVRHDHARAEIGYNLVRARQGQGLGREAIQLALSFAFETLGLQRIEADVDPRNERSWHLLESLGFRREGRLRQRWRVKGEITDGVFYGLLRDEYRPR